MQPPNDQRNFVHKRIIGAGRGFLTGGFSGAARGFVGGGGRTGGQPVSPGSGSIRARVSCPAGTVSIPGRSGREVNSCAAVGSSKALQFAIPRFAGGGGGGMAGEVTMGRYGAAYEPMIEERHVRECLPGDVLGDDGFCYPKGSITNKQREYPRGTRPLGTPGEMAALRKAAAFGRRMETTVKRMQKIGVLKKPRGGRSRAPARAPRQIGPGPSIINVE